MPKKKSVRLAAKTFSRVVNDLWAFLQRQEDVEFNSYLDWIYEYAIIRLYRGFEILILEALVGAINNDSKTVSSRTGIQFPKHMTDEVCRYLIVGDGYFDFRGREGLIRTIKGFVPDSHYLLAAVKNEKYRAPIDRLIALRNWSAHGSAASKRRMKEALGSKKVKSAGAWLRRQGRFKDIASALFEFATSLELSAPY